MWPKQQTEKWQNEAANNSERSRHSSPDKDYCLILGFTAEYSKSVRKFTAT